MGEVLELFVHTAREGERVDKALIGGSFCGDRWA